MEVVLVVDGSFSIGSTIFNNNVKGVLRNFATILYNIGSRVSMGLVLYSHMIDHVIDLTGDVTKYHAGIDGLPYPAGGTYTDLGIKEAADMFRRLGTPGVTKVRQTNPTSREHHDPPPPPETKIAPVQHAVHTHDQLNLNACTTK